MYCLAVIIAYKYPEQAAEMSKETGFLAPISFWTRQAIDCKLLSGLMVATRISSIFSAGIADLLKTFLAALMARSLVFSSDAATRRSLMPVRVRIHSSVVSTIFSRSKLVSLFSGRYLPTAIIPTLRIIFVGRRASGGPAPDAT